MKKKIHNKFGSQEGREKYANDIENTVLKTYSVIGHGLWVLEFSPVLLYLMNIVMNIVKDGMVPEDVGD